MNIERRAYVLLSGGVDSTTCLYIAHKVFGQNVVGLSIYYGQRHAKEIEAAAASCALLNLPHQKLDISAVVPPTMLTSREKKIPNVSYDEIVGVSPTYVPFRNGLLISAAASHIAGALQDVLESNVTEAPEWSLYFGAHAEDAQRWAYPDCTPEFIGALANALYIGTYRTLRLCTPLEWLTKPEVIKLGYELNVDFRCTWSCYVGNDLHCGVCPTCRARYAGFKKAGMLDPTDYERLPD